VRGALAHGTDLAVNSLRAYVDALARRADLRVVERPVDPYLELGAIVRRGYETSAPAPLFQRILGCEPGIRVLGASAGLSSDPRAPLARVALSLEADPASTAWELIDRITGAFDLPPVPPRVVADGPCKETCCEVPRWT
jgi:UbiD family decarboxylase